MIVLLAALVAEAASPAWESRPYWLPVVNVRAVTVDDGGRRDTSAQAVVGVEGGVVARSVTKPHWMSLTRTSVTGIYSFTNDSLGADLRVGSFFGPDGKVVRYLIGPDVWTNGYGVRDSTDYWLAWSPGIDVRNQLLIRIVRGIGLVGEATPGWVAAPSRQRGGIGPFHELLLMGGVAIDSDVMTITIGYQHQWLSVGTIESIVITGGLRY